MRCVSLLGLGLLLLFVRVDAQDKPETEVATTAAADSPAEGDTNGSESTAGPGEEEAETGEPAGTEEVVTQAATEDGGSESATEAPAPDAPSDTTAATGDTGTEADALVTAAPDAETEEAVTQAAGEETTDEVRKEEAVTKGEEPAGKVTEQPAEGESTAEPEEGATIAPEPSKATEEAVTETADTEAPAETQAPEAAQTDAPEETSKAAEAVTEGPVEKTSEAKEKEADVSTAAPEPQVTLDPNDPCSFATIDEGRDRYYQTPNEDGCDSGLKEGWYKFTLNGEPAEIPDKCIKHAYCGTYMGFSVDLEGKALPAEGEVIEARLCGGHDILQQSTKCCFEQMPLKIKRCPGDALIYHLKGYNKCASGICLKKPNEEIPYEYLGNPPPTQPPTTASPPDVDSIPQDDLTEDDYNRIVTVEFDIDEEWDNAKIEEFDEKFRPLIAAALNKKKAEQPSPDTTKPAKKKKVPTATLR